MTEAVFLAMTKIAIHCISLESEESWVLEEMNLTLPMAQSYDDIDALF